jgi:uncharacterized membrane protein
VLGNHPARDRVVGLGRIVGPTTDLGNIVAAIDDEGLVRLYNPHILSREIRSSLTSVAAVCFAGALLTDLAYIQSPDMQWTNFSAWLLAVGLVFSVLALLTAIVTFIGRGRRVSSSGWLYAVAAIIVMVLELFNNFIHSRDAWISVWPTGLALSVASVAMMAVAAALHIRNLKTLHFEDIR